jgi:hypothetical protein
MVHIILLNFLFAEFFSIYLLLKSYYLIIVKVLKFKDFMTKLPLLKNNKGLSSPLLVLILFILFIGVLATVIISLQKPVSTNQPSPALESSKPVSTPQSSQNSKELKKQARSIIFSKDDMIENDRKALDPKKIALLDSIEAEFYPNWEKIDPKFKDENNYQFFTNRYISVLNFLKNDKYEVVDAGKVAYYTKSEKDVAEPGGSGSHCLIYRENTPGSMWKEVECYQNPISCKELDKLGFTRAQTIEWRCFDYENQIERK